MARRDGKIKQQEPPPIEDDTSDFPCDIMQNILSRLPVKSLLRFKAVCKSWNATINDRGFAKMHFNQLNISNSQCFSAVGTTRDGTYKLIKFQGQESYMQSVVEFPLIEFEYNNFLCSCEGILLFKHYANKPNYVLWNPFTRNYSTFSCPYKDLIPRKPQQSYAICFDKYQDDYKVIVVLRDRTHGGKYLVYSIKNDSWAKRRSKFREYLFEFEGGSYVDGVVYWIADHDRSYRHKIIYFDPKDNLLKELHKPTDLERGSKNNVFVMNLSGNLCFYTCEQEMFKIWLLKESGGRKCWMKFMTADYSESPKSFVDRPICLTSKNEVVFYDGVCSTFAYCLEKQKFGELEEFPAALCTIIEFTCFESLNFPAIPRER